jgi:hypothetical protein
VEEEPAVEASAAASELGPDADAEGETEPEVEEEPAAEASTAASELGFDADAEGETEPEVEEEPAAGASNAARNSDSKQNTSIPAQPVSGPEGEKGDEQDSEKEGDGQEGLERFDWYRNLQETSYAVTRLDRSTALSINECYTAILEWRAGLGDNPGSFLRWQPEEDELLLLLCEHAVPYELIHKVSIVHTFLQHTSLHFCWNRTETQLLE